jgi:hypothetical protein
MFNKGQCHYVDPGAKVEENFTINHPIFKKRRMPNQQPLLASHQLTEKTKINGANLQNAGLHFL